MRYDSERSNVTLRNTSANYGWVTRLLHWTIASLIFGLIALGWYMVDLTYYDRWYNASLAWHRSLGLAALALAVLFLVWKAVSPSPALPASVAGLQRRLATGAHHLLLLLMVLVPAAGYLVSTSAGKAIDMWGWFSIPALVPVDDVLRDAAIQVHFYSAYGLGLLALGHAAAALKHQFIDCDGVLARMLWG